MTGLSEFDSDYAPLAAIRQCCFTGMRVCVCVCLCEDMAVLLRQRRMRWLGHMARMDDDRAPKCVLFGELPATRPRHGPKRRWRDIVLNDLESLGVDKTWCGLAQDRDQWRQQCVRGRPPPPS